MDRVRAVDVSKCCLRFEAATASSTDVTLQSKVRPPSSQYRKALHNVTTVQ